MHRSISALFPYLYPEQISTWDFQSSIEALKKERVTRISQIAQFIFASAVTTALIILTESPKIILPFVIPVMLITVVSWVIFFRMSNWVEAFTQDLEDQKRAEIAKQAFEQILIRSKMDELSYEELDKFFQNLNQLLECPLFDVQFMQKLNFLKAESHHDQSFAEAAIEKNVNLSFHYEQTQVIRNLFGAPSIRLYLKAEWNGDPKQEAIFQIEKKKITEQQEFLE